MYDKYKTKIRNNGISAIAVEGNIAVGKTSLARLLAKHLGGRLVEEQVDDNPFLERFYEDMGAYAFQTQLVFLMNRYKYYHSRLTISFHPTIRDLWIIHITRLSLMMMSISLHCTKGSVTSRMIRIPVHWNIVTWSGWKMDK